MNKSLLPLAAMPTINGLHMLFLYIVQAVKQHVQLENYSGIYSAIATYTTILLVSLATGSCHRMEQKHRVMTAVKLVSLRPIGLKSEL